MIFARHNAVDGAFGVKVESGNFTETVRCHCRAEETESFGDEGCCIGGFSFGSFRRGKETSDREAPPLFRLCGDLLNPQPRVWQKVSVSGGDFRPVNFAGRRVGVFLKSNNIEQILIFGLVPQNVSASPGEQASEIFSAFKSLLGENGFDFTDTVRTWFYNRDILAWYPEFNGVRTRFFAENGVFGRLVPASTGIGAHNSAGAAICAGLHAVRSRAGNSVAQAVESPLQSSAMKYKSSFSRAVEIAFPGHRKLYISGTASIDKSGESVHIGDSPAQLAETMRVVEALLRSRGMDWENVSRAIAYFRRASDIPLFKKFCDEKKLPPLPAIAVNATICRDNLLFELEADAIAD